MTVDRGRESAAQIGGDTVFGSAGDDGVTENPSGIAQVFMGDGQGSSLFYAPENGKQFFWRDGVDRTFADVGEEIFFKNADDRLLIGGSPQCGVSWYG